MAFSALEALQTFGLGRQMAQQDRQQRTRQAASQQAARGDYSGAATTALAGGDLDFATQIRQMNSQHQAQALQEAQILGGVSGRLAAIADPAARQAQWAAIRPQIEQLGIFAPHELDGVDLSDAGLQGYSSFANSITNALHPRTQNPTSFQQDDEYIRSRYGEEAGDQYVQRHIAPPPITQHNADGTITIIPQAAAPLRRGQAQQQPATMTPDQLRAAAAEAIRQGADPAQVEAELRRMLGGNNPASDTRPQGMEAPAFFPNQNMPSGNPLDPNLAGH